MKTLIRIVLVIFIIGILLTMVAFVSGVNLDGITDYISDDGNYGDEINIESTTTIDTLDIDLETRNIEVTTTAEDHITITYHEHDRDTWTTSESNGKLTLKQAITPVFFNWFNFKIASYDVKTVFIEIPSTWVVDYTLKSSTGNIKYIEGPMTATDIFIDSDTGDVQLKHVTMNSLDINLDTGRASLENLIITGDLNVESDTGDLNLTNITAEEVILDTETGDIIIDDLTSSSLHAETSTGNITLNNSESTGAINISSNTGDVSISESTGTGYDLSSDTGDIRFTMSDSMDLKYDLSTTTSKITVNGDDQGTRHSTSSGSILLKAKSTTGKIIINVQD